MASELCSTFVNRPPGTYRPLVCKPVVFETRDIKGTGLQNKQNFFFLTKPNTIRERATIDLLYPTPFWLKQARQGSVVLTFERVTSEGNPRVTTDDFLRVVLEA
jgi:hypothetical protein